MEPLETPAVPQAQPIFAKYPPVHYKAPVLPFEACNMILPLLEFAPAPVATAASVRLKKISFNAKDAATVILSGDALEPWFKELMHIHPTGATNGICLSQPRNNHRCVIHNMAPGTGAAKIKHWQSCLRGAYLLMIGDYKIKSIADAESAISKLCLANIEQTTICVAKDAVAKSLSATGLPQIYFDQLQTVR